MIPLLIGLALQPCTVDLYNVANRFAPPEKAWAAPTHPETLEERRLRYALIAADICKVVAKDKSVEGFTKKQTARLVMGMAIGESGLVKDADVGPCYRKGKAWRRCDGGRAVGLLQVWVNRRERDHYFANRKALISRGLQALRGSFNACRALPIDQRLSVYASGTCQNAKGIAASRRRWKLITRVLGWRI